jgi:predicted P-loop ATPase
MLAMVAQWMNLSRDYGNAVVPMLIGRQGTHKSTFCRLLLPPELREYYIDDIKLDNAEQVERMLSRMLLVNIDEYNAKTDREQAKIKRVLTEKDVQTRKMRSDQYELRPRMASFIATTNEQEPLVDPTGSRRYLCCEVTGLIDTDTPIDYRQLYAQAVQELHSGAQWHFTKAEEEAICQHNERYRRESTPETLLLSFFEPAERSKECFLRAVDIQAEIKKHVQSADVPNIKMLTMALKACRFPYGAIQGCRGWYARLICR